MAWGLQTDSEVSQQPEDCMETPEGHGGKQEKVFLGERKKEKLRKAKGNTVPAIATTASCMRTPNGQ